MYCGWCTAIFMMIINISNALWDEVTAYNLCFLKEERLGVPLSRTAQLWVGPRSGLGLRPRAASARCRIRRRDQAAPRSKRGLRSGLTRGRRNIFCQLVLSAQPGINMFGCRYCFLSPSAPPLRQEDWRLPLFEPGLVWLEGMKYNVSIRVALHMILAGRVREAPDGRGGRRRCRRGAGFQGVLAARLLQKSPLSGDPFSVFCSVKASLQAA